MTSVTELLNLAKAAIGAGETSLRAAAEYIAQAEQKGARQRDIAAEVGKSVGWVNRLLMWRKSGYQDDTAFGPQAKASRQRKKDQTTEQKKSQPATTSEQAQAAAERARAETAKADAAKAKAEAAKAKAEAQRAKADADRAKAESRAKAKANANGSFRGSFGSPASSQVIDSRAREILVKALGMLGSAHDGERAAAAVVVEKQRVKLGMIWDDLIIPADVAHARAA